MIIDEIQRKPDLFEVLRVLVDRESSVGRFLILGSASPPLIEGISESLADEWSSSILPDSDEDNHAWREGFIPTFIKRGVPQQGISIPAPAMRRVASGRAKRTQ